MPKQVDVRAELQRIQEDRHYFNEQYLKIRTKGYEGVPSLAPLKYRSAQNILDKAVKKQEDKGQPVRAIILKARQEGISTYVEGYMFKKTILNKMIRSLIVAHDTKSAIGLFSMSQLFYDCLPNYLRPMKRFSNRRELLFENPDDRHRHDKPGLRSHMYVGTANNLDLGRSETIQHAHLSEFAFWPDALTLMTSLMQAIPDAPGTSVFIESTANGMGNYFYDLYWGAKAGTNDFVPVFIPWFIHEEYKRPGPSLGKIDKYETWLRDKFELSDDQLRWRRYTIRNKCQGSILKFQQEYPATDHEAFIVSGHPVFDVEKVINMMRIAPEPKITGGIEVEHDKKIYKLKARPDGKLKVWKYPEPNKSYVIGADVAEGVQGGDFSAAEVLCREDFEQVAEWHGLISPDEFALELADLGFYYNTALLAVEKNNAGVATLSRLRTLYWNLFCMFKMDNIQRIPVKTLGWTTSTKTRPLIIDGITKVLREGEMIFNGTELLEELTFMVYEYPKSSVLSNPPLRPQAQKGKHDDRIFALGIAIQAHLQAPMLDKAGNLVMVNERIVENLNELPAATMEDRRRKRMAELCDPMLREERLAEESGFYDDFGGF